jgi:flagellar basal-body rod protein FlgF
MSNITYATLTRQDGLRNEMQAIANNIANVSTRGFRRESLVFSEFVQTSDTGDSALSMARAEGRIIDRGQGQLGQTGGQFDFAIEGDGYFLVATPEGERLTRAGSFQPSPEGDLVTPDGARLLDAGGSPVFVPPDAAAVSLASDGTLSVDGRALTQLGLFEPADPNTMIRETGLRFDPGVDILPVENPTIVQGFLEDSNVDPILEVARMIEVQRAYENGRNLLSSDHERIRALIETLGK